MIQSDPHFPGLKTVVYGHSRTGLPFEEFSSGQGDRSILFVTGFCAQERTVSQTLKAWLQALSVAENQGRSFLGFDSESLKKKGEIRIIPGFDPNIVKINRNGIINQEKSVDNSIFFDNGPYNDRGVDLNRNFGSNWLKAQRNPTFSDHCGPFPESEAEVACFTARIRQNPPCAGILLRHGNKGLFYPREATEKELREAQFLARYVGLPLFCAEHAEASALQWLTDRGIKALEYRTDSGEEISDLRTQRFLTMCVALT